MDQEPARQRRIERPMMSVTRRITALRSLRRDKRVERLGGYPARVPELSVESFEPVLNHTERLCHVTDGVSRLGAESIDEATGNPLDNLVNAQGHEWQRRLGQQYYAYQAAGRRRLRHLQGVVEQYRHLYELDMLRLRGAEVAAESAMLTLSGEQPDSPQGGGHQAAGAPAVTRRDPGSAPASGQEDLLAGPVALPPSRVSRAELRRIFEPRDADRVPHWAEPGFRDATLLGGRPRSTYVHMLVLLVAAGADIGAFSQVVERAMPDQSDLMVFLVVGGLAAVVLYIAHMIGVMLREAKATYPRGADRRVRLWSWISGRVTPAGCAIAWGALGFLAYWVRIHVPPPTTAQVGVGTIGGGSAPSGAPTDPHAAQAALLFLGLYVATGIVAAVGAYFTHNPYRGRYVAALRAYRKAAERAAASANQLGRAEASCQRQVTELQNADSILAEAQALDKAFTEQLKQSVRLQIATMARDPAVTDAIFDEDRDPYWRSQNGSTPNGHGPGVPRP
jgi:hypothetical protein